MARVSGVAECAGNEEIHRIEKRRDGIEVVARKLSKRCTAAWQNSTPSPIRYTHPDHTDNGVPLRRWLGLPVVHYNQVGSTDAWEDLEVACKSNVITLRYIIRQKWLLFIAYRTVKTITKGSPTSKPGDVPFRAWKGGDQWHLTQCCTPALTL